MYEYVSQRSSCKVVASEYPVDLETGFRYAFVEQDCYVTCGRSDVRGGLDGIFAAGKCREPDASQSASIDVVGATAGKLYPGVGIYGLVLL